MNTGLIPQAPIHTQSLVVLGQKEKDDEETKHARGQVAPFRNGRDASRDASPTETFQLLRKEVPVSVVEQRVSNLAQGAMCLILLTGPFLHILGLIPRGVCVDDISCWHPFDTRHIPPIFPQASSAAFCKWIF
jgi:boron transporter